MTRVEYTKILRLFGLRVRQLRYAKDWNQVDLAAQLDWRLSRSAISYIENGRKCPSVEALIEIARGLEVEPASLLLSPGQWQHHAAAEAVLSCGGGSKGCEVQKKCIECCQGRAAKGA